MVLFEISRNSIYNMCCISLTPKPGSSDKRVLRVSETTIWVPNDTLSTILSPYRPVCIMLVTYQHCGGEILTGLVPPLSETVEEIAKNGPKMRWKRDEIRGKFTKSGRNSSKYYLYWSMITHMPILGPYMHRTWSICIERLAEMVQKHRRNTAKTGPKCAEIATKSGFTRAKFGI